MSRQALNLRRFIHWGPLTALMIIKCITLITLFMNSMWWPPNESLSAFFNQAIFVFLSCLSLINYVMATIIGPGVLPPRWMPENPNDIHQMQYCKTCEGYKAPRSHHCRNCDRCVKKMDHHCPWINNCVGWANHAYFCYFLLFSIAGSLYASIILGCAFHRGINRYWYLMNGQLHLATVQFTLVTITACILALGLAIGVVIALSMLLYYQLKSVVKNQTGIEMWIMEKAMFRRRHNPDIHPFTYPYDLGVYNNIRQVFVETELMKGDGIHWPVLNNCDQYTLTREQINQKVEKRNRRKVFKCIRRATGSYLPLFSQGVRVCMSPPCTDEARIKLNPGDIIHVTRLREHWLFGERIVSDDTADATKMNKKHQCPRRGWFPRRCAIELVEADNCVKFRADGDDRTCLPEIQNSDELLPNECSSKSASEQQNGGHKTKTL